MGQLIIDGDKIYELDEACMKERERQKKEKNRVSESAREDTGDKNKKSKKGR